MSEFVPENQLEALLVRAATDPAARPDFYRELVRATLLVLTPDVPDAESSRTLTTGATLSLVNWQGPGGLFVPVFTSRDLVEAVVQKVGRPMGFLGMQGGALFGVLTQRPQHAILNPGFPYGKEFTPEEIRAIADGTLLQAGERHEVKAATQVQLGQPAVYPTALVEALVRLFRQRPSVEAAYLAQIGFPEQAPHAIVGIVSSDYGKDGTDAGVVASEVGGPSPVGFVDMTAGANGTLERYFRQETTPFYERGKS